MLTDGSTTRTLVLVEATASFDGTQVSGTTAPGVDVSVGVAGLDCGESFLAAAGGDGSYAVDVTTGEGCAGAFGAIEGLWVDVLEPDGDATNVDVPFGP
jgi:hypothetical protein